MMKTAQALDRICKQEVAIKKTVLDSVIIICLAIVVALLRNIPIYIFKRIIN